MFSSRLQGQPCSLCCCSLISRWPRHGLPGTRLLPSRPRGDASLHQPSAPTPPRLWHLGSLPLWGPRHPLLPRCGLPQHLSLASCTVGPPPGKGDTGAGTPSLFVTSAHLTLPVGTSARSPWREGSSLDPVVPGRESAGVRSAEPPWESRSAPCPPPAVTVLKDPARTAATLQTPPEWFAAARAQSLRVPSAPPARSPSPGPSDPTEAHRLICS